VLREIPPEMLDRFFVDHIPVILNKQNRKGTWKLKEGERITYDILTALQHLGKLPDIRTELKYDLLSNVKEKDDVYSLLIKKDFFGALSAQDEKRLERYVSTIVITQEEDGSWHNTVIGTAIEISNLLMCGIDQVHPSIARGIGYLFDHLNQTWEGFHVGEPYGFKSHYMFSSDDRAEEFRIAALLKPEWIPRQVCFNHLAVLQNAFTLNLLVKLGYDKDQRIEFALDNLFEIEQQWGGFCDSDIKKGYIREQKKQKIKLEK
jgi:hypothetical protein